jgi:UDP-3-O-[3-hydroxymyristoyl] glucosamine N-acyltransferase
MPLKWLTFRLFGYRGSMNFAIYPDTWICDLPLLNFGDGAYLSNKATLGTNIALSNGFILVDHIILEKGAYVGHLSMLAPGVHMGVNSEVGVGCGIGIKTKIGECARIGPATSLERGVSIGARVNVGSMSYIGTRSTLTEGLSIPASCLIPAKTILQKQHEVCHFVSSINKTVPVLAMSLALGLARWNGDRQSIKEECASI